MNDDEFAQQRAEGWKFGDVLGQPGMFKLQLNSPIDPPCDHTDAYGSMVMEGGPHSTAPGKRMCIGCEELVPLLREVE